MRRSLATGLMLLLVGCQPVAAPPPAPEQPSATAPVPDNAPDQVSNGFYPHMVDLVDEQNGWALLLGHEALYRTADGGQTWTNVTPPVLDGMPDADLAALSADTAWLVLTFRAPPAGEGYAPVVVYRTTDAGRHWERSQFTTPFRTLYGSSVHVLDERRAYVLVEPEHGMGSNPGVLYGTSDGGANWTQAVGGDQVPYSGKLSLVDESTGWIVGHEVSTTPNQLAYTADGGQTWATQELVSPANLPPGRVSLTDPPQPFGGHLVLHATFWPESARADQYRSLLYTSAGPGQPWELLGIFPDASALSLLPSGHGWLWAGSPKTPGTKAPIAGAFRVTADGGTTWEEMAPDTTLQHLLDEGYNVVALDFASASHGWAVLRAPGPYPPRLARTTDGGSTWAILQLAP